MEDPALIVSINAGEEEPGEGEAQDGMEEPKALPKPLLIRLIMPAEEKALPPHTRVSSLELVQEVVLPPPERHPLS
ncbi:MAG: hypothetical protein R3252_01035 [Robiginitalea sp.]|nr:hypothetical protein [Robiginitalea sp.]